MKFGNYKDLFLAGNVFADTKYYCLYAAINTWYYF